MSDEDISLTDVRDLIRDIWQIKDKNDAVLDATGGRFNIFKILGVNQHETAHSKIIASFLNPKGTHGMKERFLELFLAECFSEEELRGFNFDCKNAVVKTESSAPTDEKQGRIDIFISSGAKLIVIENKLLAGDQSHQLKRYAEYSKNNSAGFKILYLTKDGHEASEQSGGGIEYKKISYGEEILSWLESCCAESARFPLVRETLVQYANLIRHYTGGSMDAKATNEIIDTIATEENIGIARLIVRNYKNAKIKIAHELFYIFGEIESILRKILGDGYERSEKGKLGSKDFILRYDIYGIDDVRIAILFGDTVTEKEELVRLKINLEFKGGKNTPEAEKSAAIEKYRALLADIPHQVNPTEYSAWRMQFDPWETQKREILDCFAKMLTALKKAKGE